jgi:hypothetical protein
MTELVDHRIVLVDSATASTLAQILPVLLLTLAVELRRTQLHRGLSRVRIGVFFFIFGLIETTLVLSIDGAFYPFQWFDICSALIIFGLLSILFRLALSDVPEGRREQRTDMHVDSDRDV